MILPQNEGQTEIVEAKDKLANTFFKLLFEVARLERSILCRYHIRLDHRHVDNLRVMSPVDGSSI